MDNIFQTLLNALSSPSQEARQEQNPAYFGYPKEAYKSPPTPANSGLNLESLLPILMKNKGGLSSVLSSLTDNPSLSKISSILTKEREQTPPPDKEILL